MMLIDTGNVKAQTAPISIQAEVSTVRNNFPDVTNWYGVTMNIIQGMMSQSQDVGHLGLTAGCRQIFLR